ncbi:molecular chaperone [Serratia sp. JSRIV006]|uniref:fimbrial biogenesis chaperone n=1 Tax=Serratia sp. JSRIV006 TaxID=2831896 RepID=UPI001CBAF1A3|nr:molecular chaperone [Serratia sp. JSRIV006]UAN61442.1 molecular chaperone [Serratia sp. JSRIV006]
MLELNNTLNYTLLATTCLVTVPAQSAVSLDGTRAIFNGGETSMMLNVNNDNKQQPYLAQAWLENDAQEKILTGPLVVTPTLQRIEPGAKSLVRVASTPAISTLPQDRESLFYFNLRGIPPISENENVVQIVLQTKIKLFYRPKAIETKLNAIWQDQLVLNKVANGYRIENPTPYYVTVIGLGGTEKEAQEDHFDAVMLAPKSEQTIKARNYMMPYLTYINDYGDRPALKFQCAASSGRCLRVMGIK